MTVTVTHRLGTVTRDSEFRANSLRPGLGSHRASLPAAELMSHEPESSESENHDPGPGRRRRARGAATELSLRVGGRAAGPGPRGLDFNLSEYDSDLCSLAVSESKPGHR